MPRPVSNRIMTMRLPLCKDNFARLSACTLQQWQTQMKTRRPSTTSWQVCSVASTVQISSCLILDFNARIGRENDKWSVVMGKHGIGKCNSNGELLLALCSEFELIVTNTMFKQKDECRTTWMHPRSKHWHMIDFIITRCRDKVDIHSTRAMPGPITRCWGQKWLSLYDNRQGISKPTKLNITKLSTTSHRKSFEQEMDSDVAQWEEKEHSTPVEEWAALQQVVYNTAKTYVGKPDRKHEDWFDPPTTRSYRLVLAGETKPTREGCKPGALDPPLQHTKMPADCC